MLYVPCTAKYFTCQQDKGQTKKRVQVEYVNLLIQWLIKNRQELIEYEFTFKS